MSIPAPNPQTFEWIKGALDGSMATVMSEVTQAEKESDYARLNGIPGNLHQIHGSLRMVELDAAGMLAEDLETLCMSICDSAGTESDDQQEQIRVLRRGLDSLQGYIDSVSRQTPVSPLSLVDQINQIRKITGGQQISKLELFDPPLGKLSFDGHNGEESAAIPTSRKVVPDDLRVRLVTQLRRKYRRALLCWLANRGKQDSSGEYLATINDLLQHLFRISSLDISQQLWWVASGFVEAVAAGHLDADKRIKSQFARLDIEISRLEQESISGIATDPPDELLREMLFFLGPIENADSDRIRQIQKTLELPQWFGTDIGEYEQLAETSAQLRRIGEEFGADEFDRIEALVSAHFSGVSPNKGEGNQGSLDPALQHLASLSEQAGLEPMSRLINQLAATTTEIEMTADTLTATAADIKIASALLFVRNSVIHAESIDATWEHSVNSYIEELVALSAQSEKSKDRAIQIKKVAEVEYHHARSAASGEIKEVLAQIEETLTRFESDEDELDNEKLGAAADQLKQIQSVFLIADNPTAAELCSKIAESISRLLSGAFKLDKSAVEQIAFASAATGAAADHLAGRGPDVKAALEKALNLLDRIEKNKSEHIPQQETEVADELKADRQSFAILIEKLEHNRQLLDPDRADSIERLSDIFVVMESEFDLEPAGSVPTLAGYGRTLCAALLDKEFVLDTNHKDYFEQLEAQLKKLGNRDTDTDLEGWGHRLKKLISDSKIHEEVRVQDGEQDVPIDDGLSSDTVEELSDESVLAESRAQMEQGTAAEEDEDPMESLPVIDLQAELAALTASLKEDEPEDDFMSMMDAEIELDEEVTAFTPEVDKDIPYPAFEDEEFEEDSDVSAAEDDEQALDVQNDVVQETGSQLSSLGDLSDEEDDEADTYIGSPAHQDSETEGAILVQLDQDLKSIFVSEFTAHLERLERDVSRLTQTGRSAIERDEIILDVDECIHTLAGNCRNLGFDEAAVCAEAGMEQLRHGIGSQVEGDALLRIKQGLTLLQQALDQIREHGKYDDGLAAALLHFQAGSLQVTESTSDAPSDTMDSSEIGSNQIELETLGMDAVQELDDHPESGPFEEEPDKEEFDVEIDREVSAADSGDIYGADNDDIDEEIRQIFMEETEGILSRINNHLIEWREQGLKSGVLAGIRREFHTLKGSAAATGFDDISGLSHSVETLLDRSRPDPDNDDGVILNLLEEMHDGLAADLGIMSSGSKGHLPTLHRMVTELISPKTKKSDADESHDGDVADALENSDAPNASEGTLSSEMAALDTSQLSNEIVDVDPENTALASGAEPAEALDSPSEELEPWMPGRSGTNSSGAGVDDTVVGASLKIDNKKLAELINASGELSLVRTQLQNALDATRMDLDVLRASMSSMRAGLRELEIEADAQIRARPEQQQAIDVNEEFDPLQLDRYSRLQAKSREVTEMLDQLAKVERDLGNRTSSFGGVLQQQSHLGDQLQTGLMSARMVSVGESLPRLRYLVRETSKQANKNIEFEFHGGDIAVDRQVIETMMAPFEHMIRNAVIHGIEGPDERATQGKSETGHISVSLVQQGSELVVEFSDDGRGLNIDKLSDRAVELGLVKDQNDVSEVDLLQVITQPGYSTSEGLSMESGRGVGMDVVYQAVRDLGGSMSLANRPGQGVTFQFRLPVSLAVTQALLVTVANWRFAIQSRAIERLMRVPVNEIFEQNFQRMVAVDDLKLPLLSIRDRLGEPPFSGKRTYVSVVLVRLADRLAAFEVDQFEDSINIVSKVPGKQLDSIPEIAGVTVLGDSSIVLILDPEAFIDRIAPMQDLSGIEGQDLDLAPSLRRVLVVDDSLVVRKVMQKDLEADGLEVETAVDGLNALEVLDRSNFDVALVDIEMPRMNGYELLEKLRQHSRCSDLPVIIITSRSGSQHKKRAVELGADGYITKPYDISALDQLMRQVVDNKRKLH